MYPTGSPGVLEYVARHVTFCDSGFVYKFFHFYFEYTPGVPTWKRRSIAPCNIAHHNIALQPVFVVANLRICYVNVSYIFGLVLASKN